MNCECGQPLPAPGRKFCSAACSRRAFGNRKRAQQAWELQPETKRIHLYALYAAIAQARGIPIRVTTKTRDIQGRIVRSVSDSALLEHGPSNLWLHLDDQRPVALNEVQTLQSVRPAA